MKIVVSRFNEDIQWTKILPPSDIIIYNKGTPLSGTIPLPNVGREGHTYFTYIYDNYDNLDNYTVFLQGNPFDHSPKLIKQLIWFLIHCETMDINFQYLSEKILTCNINYCRYHRGLPIRWVYEHIFEKSPIRNLEFQFGSGSQFIVSKRQILKHPKEFYRKIIQLLEHSVNPIEGYVIERLHQVIFGDNTNNNNNNTTKSITSVNSSVHKMQNL